MVYHCFLAIPAENVYCESVLPLNLWYLMQRHWVGNAFEIKDIFSRVLACSFWMKSNLEMSCFQSPLDTSIVSVFDVYDCLFIFYLLGGRDICAASYCFVFYGVEIDNFSTFVHPARASFCPAGYFLFEFVDSGPEFSFKFRSIELVLHYWDILPYITCFFLYALLCDFFDIYYVRVYKLHRA